MEEQTMVGFDVKKILIGVAIVIALAWAILWYSSRPKDEVAQQPVQEEESIEQASPEADIKTTPSQDGSVDVEFDQLTRDAQNMENSELKIEDLVEGTGEEAKAGNSVTVNYVGTLTDGTKFDSSYDRNQPFTFSLGAGSVIKGWDQGVAGMKVGGKRKLTIPPQLGYGSRDQGSIPPNSTLIFEVELLEVN